MTLKFRTRSDWRTWQQSQEPVLRRHWRRFKARSTAPTYSLSIVGSDSAPAVLIALDSLSPSSRAALVAPAQELLHQGFRLVVLAPARSQLPLMADHRRESIPPGNLEAQLPDGIAAALAIGDHLPLGDMAHRIAQDRNLLSLVVQHGSLTPFSPPPPAGCTLLAWSDADLEFWAGGRDDLAGVTCGSQLLWEAAQRRSGFVAPADIETDRVVFLGQLHGAEMPRSATRTSISVLRQNFDVAYKPHPVESDILSHVQHTVWRRQGLTVLAPDDSIDINRPVLAHFSTGLLEAAAAGMPAYGYCARPPRWVEEFWERNGIARFGDPSPTVVLQGGEQPAVAIARYVRSEIT